MIGGVTRHGLPHLSGVPHLYIKQREEARLILRIITSYWGEQYRSLNSETSIRWNLDISKGQGTVKIFSL